MSKEFNLSLDLTKGSKLSKSISIIALLAILIATVIYIFTDKQAISYGVLLFVALTECIASALRDFKSID